MLNKRVTALSLLTLLVICSACTTYTVNGNVKAENHCEGTLPKDVKVSATLTNGAQSRTRSATSALPGVYTVNVRWPKWDKPPKTWSTVTATRTDGSDICEPFKCDPPKHCSDVAMKQKNIPVAGKVTTYDIEIRCECH